METPPAARIFVPGTFRAQAARSTLPRTAVTGAISANLPIISGLPMSPAWTMYFEPLRARTASGRSTPCVSEITPITMAPLLRRHDGDNQCRRMLRIMVDRVGGGHELPAGVAGLEIASGSRVRVAVEPREITAGNLQPHDVPFLENVAGGPEVDREFVDLARVHQRRCFPRIAIACPQNSFGQILREAVRPDIHQLAGEIRVHC